MALRDLLGVLGSEQKSRSVASKVLMMSILLRTIKGSYRKDASGKGNWSEINEY